MINLSTHEKFAVLAIAALFIGGITVGNIAPSPKSVTVATAAVSFGMPAFDRNLWIRDEGEDVQRLQEFLNAQGFIIARRGDGSPGNESTYFGGRTVAALVKFQHAHNIRPRTGRFDAQTREVVNSLLGASSVSGLQLQTIGTNQVQLSWDAVSGAESYTLQRKDPGASDYMTLATGVTTTPYTDTVANPDGIFWYAVVPIAPALTASIELGAPPPPPSGSFNIYVDSIAGSDSNTGTSETSPLQTLAAARTAALAHGDGVKIGLKRGSHWREDLDLNTVDNVTVEAYGTGAMPILDGSSVVTNGTFSATAGYANVYEVAVTQVPLEGYISVWENGDMLQFVDSIVDVAATPGSFHIPDDGTGSGKTGDGVHTVYVHAKDSSNIASNGMTYEVTDAARYGVLALGDNANVKHVHTKRNLQADGSFTAGHDSYIYGSVFEDGIKHNSLVTSGTYERSVAFGGGDGARTGSIMMEFYASNGAGKTVTYKDSIAVCNENAPLNSGITGFGGHNQGPGTYYTQWNATDVVASECETGFSLNAEAVNIMRAYAHENYWGIGGNAYSTPFTITDVKIVNTTTPIHRGIAVSNDTNALTIEGLRAYIANDAAAASTNKSVMFAPKGGTITLNRSAIYIANTTDLWYAVIGYILDGATINASGNHIVNASGYDRLNLWEWYSPGVGTLGTVGSNAYWTDTHINARVDGTAYSNVSSYFLAVQGAGKETNSVVANPVFANPVFGEFTATSSGLPANSGLEHPNITYHSVPRTIQEALQFADQ